MCSNAWRGISPVPAVTEQRAGHGIPCLRGAIELARLPCIHNHVAAMPDVHWGRGATVGSVIATKGAIIPAAVGVDIGCGMMAMRTSLRADQLPDNLAAIRTAIEKSVPHGGIGFKGGWKDGVPARVATQYRNSGLGDRLAAIEDKHPKIAGANSLVHAGSLGGFD